MIRKYVLAGVALLLMLTVQLSAAEKLAEGNYKLTYTPRGASTLTYFLVKIEYKDGKPVATLAATAPNLRPGSVVFNGFTREGDDVVVKISVGGSKYSFEGTVSDKNKVVGNFGGERFLFPGTMTSTDATELKRSDVSTNLDIPSLVEANRLKFQPLILRGQARRTTDKEAKAKLLQQATEAQEKADKELPKLYQTAVEKVAGQPAGFHALADLLALSSTKDAKVEDVKKWITLGTKNLKAYGSRWEVQFATQLAEALVKHKNKALATLALDHLNQAQKLLTDKSPADQKVKVQKVLVAALELTADEDALKGAKTKLASLEKALDDEYEKKVPPFKVEKFKGRKGKSKRVVVMELFTGAQCPPCVAADVAFDALEKAYEPKDLVLLQYHLHIPGPDPLTNSDSEARQKYYGSAIRGTPTTLFNGKSQAGGGGGMTAAARKFGQYREVIDAMLEEEAQATVSAKAVQDGDDVNITVEVSGLKELDEKKLRIVLVEEKVRYIGGNGLRFHHQVVRDFPGGVEGKLLKDDKTTHKVKVNLNEVRKSLKDYVEKYEKTRKFPNADRPRELKNLKVIAFVQDDKTKEILQAAEVDVEGGK